MTVLSDSARENNDRWGLVIVPTLCCPINDTGSASDFESFLNDFAGDDAFRIDFRIESQEILIVNDRRQLWKVVIDDEP